MTNTNSHQNPAPARVSQPHTAIEQILPTNGLAHAGNHTTSRNPAWQTRALALDVPQDISASEARLPAKRKEEWASEPTHNGYRAAIHTPTRPDNVPTRTRLSEPNRQPATHQRQVVTLMQLRHIAKTGEPRPNIRRPDIGLKTYTSGPTNSRGDMPADPDNSQKVFTHAKRPPRGVRQDKGFLTKALSATQQAAPLRKGQRAGAVNKDSPRSQNVPAPQKPSGARVKLVHTTLWLHPLVRSELERIAGCERLTLSQVGATALDQWVRQKLHAQHEALLYPVLRQLIRDELAAFGNRLVFFLMRIAFAAEQTRILVTNILDRMLKKDGVEPKVFNRLVDQSSRMAKRNIIARTPQIKSLLQEWEEAGTPDAAKDGKKGEKID